MHGTACDVAILEFTPTRYTDMRLRDTKLGPLQSPTPMSGPHAPTERQATGTQGDVTQALWDAENALRDFIALTLSRSHGSDWVTHSGVSADRIARWKDRKTTEAKRQLGGVVEERLLYYADFYDLKTILKKHWGQGFSQALGDWRTFEVLLIELERLRDPDAHRRELLPHQKHLVIGISGEIRNRIVRYRSKMETSDDCFPRIESVRDSLGHIWVPEDRASLKTLFTDATIRTGDTIEFVVTATDPEDTPLDYAIGMGDVPGQWQDTGSFVVMFEEKHIRRVLTVGFYIRGHREYHASGFYDDCVDFCYRVLPAPRIPGK